jgi:hypothetical protein
MNIFRRIQLARDRKVTVANLVDELVRRKGDCETSVGDEGRFSSLRTALPHLPNRWLSSPFDRAPPRPARRRLSQQQPALFHWFLAIIRAGGIAVPLNPLLSLAEVRRILADSGTEILVTDKAVFRTQHRGPRRAECAHLDTSRRRGRDTGWIRALPRHRCALSAGRHRSGCHSGGLPYFRHQRLSQRGGPFEQRPARSARIPR